MLTHAGTVYVGVCDTAMQSASHLKVPILITLPEHSIKLLISVIEWTTLSWVGSSPVGNLAHTSVVFLIVGESSGALCNWDSKFLKPEKPSIISYIGSNEGTSNSDTKSPSPTVLKHSFISFNSVSSTDIENSYKNTP